MRSQPYIIQLPKIPDPRGNLSFIQNHSHIPFDIARCYWIYDVPGGLERYGHAFRRAAEFIVALSGSFDVVVEDGCGERRFHLSRSFYGVYLPPMTWRKIDNFSTNSVALVLSSTDFDENDYIRDFDLFLAESAATFGDNAEERLEMEQCTALSAEETRSEAHSISLVTDCEIRELPRIQHPNGSLTVVDTDNEPFSVPRVFYIYDVPGDASRGGHSHFLMQELIVAVSGSFDVRVCDGDNTRVFTLNRPYRGLYIPSGIWRSLDNFSSGSVCLVLASKPYDESDYVRSFDRFLQLSHDKKPRN